MSNLIDPKAVAADPDWSVGGEPEADFTEQKAEFVKTAEELLKPCEKSWHIGGPFCPECEPCRDGVVEVGRAIFDAYLRGLYEAKHGRPS